MDMSKQVSGYLDVTDDGSFNYTSGFDSSGSTYTLELVGSLVPVNSALSILLFKPDCPIYKAMTISVVVTAQGDKGLPASGQIVSVAAGEGVEVRGSGVTTVVDT